MALKGFRSLTSARHLEYFKIPLSKKKYLCKQKCRELKTNKTHQKSHKQKNSTNISSSLPFLWRKFPLLLCHFFVTKPHQVSPTLAFRHTLLSYLVPAFQRPFPLFQQAALLLLWLLGTIHCSPESFYNFPAVLLKQKIQM